MKYAVKPLDKRIGARIRAFRLRLLLLVKAFEQKIGIREHD
jgi:hypothetical protein